MPGAVTAANPIDLGLPLGYLWLTGGAVLFTAVVLPLLDRRDIAVHG